MHDLRMHVIPVTNEGKDSIGNPINPYDVTPQKYV